MRIVIFVFTLLFWSGAQLPADAAQPPAIIALTATQHTDGLVELTDGTGFFSVAITNTGGAGRVHAAARLDGDSETARLRLCETEPATGACLVPPAEAILFDVEPGDQRSFAVFIRLLEPAGIEVLPEITVSFTAPDGARLGSVATVAAPALQAPRSIWLLTLLLAGLAYAAIMVIYRVFYSPAGRPATD